MPETIAAYIATATLTASSTLTFSQILIATKVAFYVAVAAASTGYSNSQRRKAERRSRNAYVSSLQDRNISLRGTLQARQLVLGRVRTGGVLVFAGSTGADKEKLTLVLALASHRIAGVDAVYFNDELVPLDGNGYATSGTYNKGQTVSVNMAINVVAGAATVVLASAPAGPVVATATNGDLLIQEPNASVSGLTVTLSGFGSSYTGAASLDYQTSSGTPRARVRWVLGSDDQAAFADLVSQFPGQWTSDHRLRGTAYLVAELDFDPDVYPAGIPNISAVVRGADQVVDPRTGTVAYTENPALLMRHYLLHPMGGRRTAAQLDDASIIAAANVCDTAVNYGGGTVALYTAGTVASTEQTPASVCDELAEAMAGRWGYSGGVLRVRAGSIGSAVAAIDADWLTEGSITVQPRRPRADLGNVMQGSFVDPDSGWQVVPFPRVPLGDELAALVAEDGGMELPQDIEFAAVTRVGQAQQVAATLLREARQALTVTIDCNLRAYGLQMFDTVSLTLPRYGWDAKLFEVTTRSFTLGGAIRLTLRETASSIYAFGTSFGSTDAAPNTSLPNPWVVPTIGTITASSGAAVLADGSVIARVVLTWPAVADSNVTQGGYVEVAYRDAAVGTAEWQIVRADSYVGHVVVGLRGGRAYLFRARAVNGLGVRGRWSLQTSHTVWKARAPAIYRQASEPTVDVRDGDVWFDSDAGNAQYVRISGAWVSVRDAGIAQALSDAAAAQATADGKIDTFWQTTAPGSASEGDLWFDTDDSFKQYRRTSGVWVLAADTRIGQAITAASDAQATADGKVVTFVQTSAPTAEAVGDLWLDSDDGFKMYRWSGSAWVSVRDSGIAQALSDAAAAQATADGKIDTFWQTTAPGSASEGDIWFDTDDGYKQYRRTSGVWVLAADTRIGQAISDAADAQATADGKVVTFVATSAPTAEGVGDLWLDSDDGNKLYRWSGSAWVALAFGTGAIAANVATEITFDEVDLAGATGTIGAVSVMRSVVVTPAVACQIEFTATVAATNVVGDSGNKAGWQVTPAGGSTVALGGSQISTTARQQLQCVSSFSAAASVALTFELIADTASGNPAQAFFKSYMRITQIKR